MKKLGLVLSMIVIVFLGYVALKPSEYVISRQITIDAPVEKVWPYLNSTRLADEWGPWREEDPAAKMSYEGPDSGVGAKSSWTDGKKLGTGSATIVESVPNDHVGIHLEYREPMNMIQEAQYLVKSNGPQTTVTWRVEGKNRFSERLMCTFMNMDKVVGGFFEKGLAKLKTIVEKRD